MSSDESEDLPLPLPFLGSPSPFPQIWSSLDNEITSVSTGNENDLQNEESKPYSSSGESGCDSAASKLSVLEESHSTSFKNKNARASRDKSTNFHVPRNVDSAKPSGTARVPPNVEESVNAHTLEAVESLLMKDHEMSICFKRQADTTETFCPKKTDSPSDACFMAVHDSVMQEDETHAFHAAHLRSAGIKETCKKAGTNISPRRTNVARNIFGEKVKHSMLSKIIFSNDCHSDVTNSCERKRPCDFSKSSSFVDSSPKPSSGISDGRGCDVTMTEQQGAQSTQDAAACKRPILNPFPKSPKTHSQMFDDNDVMNAEDYDITKRSNQKSVQTGQSTMPQMVSPGSNLDATVMPTKSPKFCAIGMLFLDSSEMRPPPKKKLAAKLESTRVEPLYDDNLWTRKFD